MVLVERTHLSQRSAGSYGGCCRSAIPNAIITREVTVPAKRPKFIAAPKYKKQFIAAKRLAALNAAEGKAAARDGAARDGKGRVTQVAHRSGHAGGAHRFLHMRGSAN